MAKKTRVTQLPFAANADVANVGKFGSKYNGAPATTKDPSLIQSLANWGVGLIQGVIGTRTPCLEDFNGIFLVAFYQLCYLLETGIPEWDVATEYSLNSFCQVNGVLFRSLTNGNTGNNPISDTVNWAAYISSGYKEVKMFTGTIAEIAIYYPGWQLCDGTNGTADLRRSFITCATADEAGVAKTDITGTLLKSGNGAVKAHHHAVTVQTRAGNSSGIPRGAAWCNDDSTNGPASADTSDEGGDKNIAVFYALCFIQKPVV